VTNWSVPQRPAVYAEQALLTAVLDDTPEAFASFDWTLHHILTVASGNPAYTLILNGSCCSVAHWEVSHETMERLGG
jgi:DNA-binding FadR family transcriptional regulator